VSQRSESIQGGNIGGRNASYSRQREAMTRAQASRRRTVTRPLTMAARLAVGLASLTLLGGCTAGATPSPSQTPTSALPSPSASPAPSPAGTPSPPPSKFQTEQPTATPRLTPSAEPQWQRVPDQTVFADSTMSAVAGGPDLYVAVGQARAGDQDVGMTWTSGDGRLWRRASAPLADGLPTGVIHDRIGYVAWGGGPGGAAVWTSPDGEVWRPASLIPNVRNALITGVARLGNDLVAVGYAEIASGNNFVQEFRTWTSPDGLAWTSVNPVTSIPWNGDVSGVTAADGALVAWGDTRAGDVSPPATLRSTDGRRWDVGWVKPGVDGYYMREGISGVIGVGSRLVAVGWGLAGQAGSPPPPSAAWTSADGLMWKSAAFRSEPATGSLLRVVWYEGEDVALGLSGVDSVAWRSVDGTAWTRSTSAPDAGRDGEGDGCTGGRCPITVVNDLAVGPAGLVAVGESSPLAGGRRAVVWIAPAG
jgi:hypothetical protein